MPVITSAQRNVVVRTRPLEVTLNQCLRPWSGPPGMRRWGLRRRPVRTQEPPPNPARLLPPPGKPAGGLPGAGRPPLGGAGAGAVAEPGCQVGVHPEGCGQHVGVELERLRLHTLREVWLPENHPGRLPACRGALVPGPCERQAVRPPANARQVRPSNVKGLGMSSALGMIDRSRSKRSPLVSRPGDVSRYHDASRSEFAASLGA